MYSVKMDVIFVLSAIMALTISRTNGFAVVEPEKSLHGTQEDTITQKVATNQNQNLQEPSILKEEQPLYQLKNQNDMNNQNVFQGKTESQIQDLILNQVLESQNQEQERSQNQFQSEQGQNVQERSQNQFQERIQGQGQTQNQASVQNQGQFEQRSQGQFQERSQKQFAQGKSQNQFQQKQNQMQKSLGLQEFQVQSSNQKERSQDQIQQRNPKQQRSQDFQQGQIQVKRNEDKFQDDNLDLKTQNLKQDIPSQNQNQFQDKTQDVEEHVPEKPRNESRRSLSKYKRFEIRQRTDDPEEQYRDASNEKHIDRALPEKPATNFLENLLSALETMIKHGGGGQRSLANDKSERAGEGDGVDRIEKTLRDLSLSNLPTNIIYRAQQDYDVKPSFIRFKSSDQPSLKLEITSNSIVKFLESILSTPSARRYAEAAGRHAAVAFSALSDKYPNLRRLTDDDSPPRLRR